MIDPSPTPLASPATVRALELPGLLAVLAELAATDLGREQVLASEPLGDPEAFERQRRLYEEAAALVEQQRLVSSFDFPLGDLLAELASGRPGAAGLALVHLKDLLDATEEIRKRLAEVRPGTSDPLQPELARLAETLPDASPLARQIARTLDRRGQVREDASPKLATLRGRIRRVRDSLYSDLKGIVDTQRENLSEETIPLRGGRLVLMLSSGSKGRVQGLTHGRSATGKSFYFEPLEVVESNNELQQATEDEEAERNRILAELLAEARRNLPSIEAHGVFLAELDRLQAAVRFAQLTGGRLAELAPRGQLRLVGARHPLLLPELAELRQAALGQGGHGGEVIPLDLDLAESSRALIVTGPNAGGKTVALKTVGLLALFHQCGYPVPAAAGTALPPLSALVATVGDEQDLLADRSTFSGRLLRLREAWEAAGPESLVLLDELGSGTDPEEGAALSISLLEELLARGTLALITTHLTPLAAAALEMPEATCAAMQFDPATGSPTYRLLPGPPGGSEALALARRLGLPRAWLDRAETRLGTGHRDLRRLLEELEAVRTELAAEQRRLARHNAELELAEARLERSREALEQERRSVGQRLRVELESFRADVRQKLSREMDRLREELAKGRRRGLPREAEERLFREQPELVAEAPTAEHPLVEGQAVRHQGLGWEGMLEKLEGSKAEVGVRGKRVRCRAEELIGLGPDKVLGGPARARPIPATSGPAAAEVPVEIHLIGQRVEPALEHLDVYLDQALLAGRQEVRVVHGHGTGRLRQAVREHLRGHPAVIGQRPGAPNEGGNGATVVELRGA